MIVEECIAILNYMPSFLGKKHAKVEYLDKMHARVEYLDKMLAKSRASRQKDSSRE